MKAPCLGGVDVLRGECDRRAREGLPDAIEQGEGRSEHDVDGVDAFDERQEGLDEGPGFAPRLVHLPVRGQDRSPHAHASSAATPGSVSPCTNSRLAPPPVER